LTAVAAPTSTPRGSRVRRGTVSARIAAVSAIPTWPSQSVAATGAEIVAMSKRIASHRGRSAPRVARKRSNDIRTIQTSSATLSRNHAPATTRQGSQLTAEPTAAHSGG